MEILLEKFAPSSEKAGGRPPTDWRSTLLQPLKVCVGPLLHVCCVLHRLFAGGFTQRPSLVTGMTIWSTPNCSGQHNCLPLSLLGWESLNFPLWSPGENSDSRQLRHCGFHLCMYVHTCKHLKYDFGVKFSHEGKECETAYTSSVCVCVWVYSAAFAELNVSLSSLNYVSWASWRSFCRAAAGLWQSSLGLCHHAFTE